MRLLRIAPGEIFPQRGHRADAELALVLQGGLSGTNGDFIRGDVMDGWKRAMRKRGLQAISIACA